MLAPLHHLETTSPLTLNKLTLSHYRNYSDLRLVVGDEPVIILGNNGSGKTNLLESISLMVPGRGLRRSPVADFQNNNVAQSWAVAADIMTPSGLLSIGTGRDNADGAIERRVIHINGKAQRNQQCLAEHIAMTWVTPDMDRILADGASARRNLIDRLAYSFDPSHKGRITRYEKAMRDRLHLIRENRVDAAWLNALEDEMAQTSTAIAATRLHMVQELQTAHSLAQSSFPRAELALIGLAEETITNQPALLVEDLLRATLRQNRDADRDAGMTTVGVHRTDLAVLHTGKNCPARFCSTGEQKALLISIILAFLRILGAARGMNPLLLLDDIAAHLDEARRRALFDEITDQGVQVWANGTDDDDYNFMHNRAQFIYVSGGRLI